MMMKPVFALPFTPIYTSKHGIAPTPAIDCFVSPVSLRVKTITTYRREDSIKVLSNEA